MSKQKLNQKRSKDNPKLTKQNVLQSYDHYIALDYIATPNNERGS